MNTDRLIDALAEDLAPAPPLPSPWLRAARWLLGAGVFLAVMILTMASPSEVATNVSDWPFVFYQAIAVLTGVMAAGATFASTVPGDSGRSVRLATVLAAIWAGSLAIGAVHEWTGNGMNLAARGEWGCVAMIVLGGGFMALMLGLMLRRGAPLTPRLTSALAMLAGAGLANVGACVSHAHTFSAIVLVWHGATVLTLVAAGALAGRWVFSWHRSRRLNRLLQGGL
jgi:hypothetical protein